jgi:DNA-3-methyladenine glycosylase II
MARETAESRTGTRDVAHPPNISVGQAAKVLAARDPVLAKLLADAGPVRLHRTTASHFSALAQTIVYQQLATPSASAIHRRVVAALGGHVEPDRIRALPDATLRATGLSTNKVVSLRDLSAKVMDGTLVLADCSLARQSDETIMAALLGVRGIGPWSAHMFLIFQLRRLDVWPVGDHGVRRGYGLAWDVATPTAQELEPLGEPFRPYRMVAALYCWRADELYGRSGPPASHQRASAGR